LGHDGPADLVGDPATHGANQRTHKRTNPGVGQGRWRIGVLQCVLHHTSGIGYVLKAEDHGNGQRQRHREADERAEGHDVQGRHRPRVLVLEDFKLLAQVALHLAKRSKLHDGQRGHNDQWQSHPHVEQTQSGRCWQIQIQTHAANQQCQPVKVNDLAKRGQGTAMIRRDRQQVVHAKPGRYQQRNQNGRPYEASVLNVGGRACQNLAENPARVFRQYHRAATNGAKQADRHHQRNQNLHGGHAKIA